MVKYTKLIVGLTFTLLFCGVVLYLGQQALNRFAPIDTPAVIAKGKWQRDLTAELKAEDNPYRVEQLRNLWAAFSEIIPADANSIIAVERMNALAGTVALAGLGPRNEAAGEIVQRRFELLLGQVSDPLDDSEREKIKEFFSELATAAEDAL